MILEPSDIAIRERLKDLRHRSHNLDQYCQLGQALEKQRRAQAELRALETEIANAVLMAPVIALPPEVEWLGPMDAPSGTVLHFNDTITPEAKRTFCVPLTKAIAAALDLIRFGQTRATEGNGGNEGSSAPSQSFRGSFVQPGTRGHYPGDDFPGAAQ